MLNFEKDTKKSQIIEKKFYFLIFFTTYTSRCIKVHKKKKNWRYGLYLESYNLPNS